MNKVKYCAKLSIIAFTITLLGGLNILPNSFKNQPVIAQNKNDFTTYEDPNWFSISYPQNWLIEGRLVDHTSTLALTLYNYNYKSIRDRSTLKHEIKTEIWVLSESFNEVVKNYSSNNSSLSGARVIKKGYATLGGRRAYRVWTTDGQFDWPDTISTFVKYNDKTIGIYSYCYADDLNVVKIIERVHGSFRISD